MEPWQNSDRWDQRRWACVALIAKGFDMGRLVGGFQQAASGRQAGLMKWRSGSFIPTCLKSLYELTADSYTVIYFIALLFGIWCGAACFDKVLSEMMCTDIKTLVLVSGGCFTPANHHLMLKFWSSEIINIYTYIRILSVVLSPIFLFPFLQMGIFNEV